MSWLSSDWTYRYPVTLIDPGGSNDKVIMVPPYYSLFWDTIDSNGYEFRITGSDGVTEIDFKRFSFTYASRYLQIILDWSSYSHSTTLSGGEAIVWLYWGKSGAADGVTSFTNTGSFDYCPVCLADPETGAAIINTWESQRATSGTPSVSHMVKKYEFHSLIGTFPDEFSHIFWLDLTPILSRAEATGTQFFFEEINQVSATVYNNSDTEVALNQKVIYYAQKQDRVFAGLLFTGNSSSAALPAGNYYVAYEIETSIPIGGTSNFQMQEYRFEIVIVDPEDV